MDSPYGPNRPRAPQIWPRLPNTRAAVPNTRAAVPNSPQRPQSHFKCRILGAFGRASSTRIASAGGRLSDFARRDIDRSWVCGMTLRCGWGRSRLRSRSLSLCSMTATWPLRDRQTWPSWLGAANEAVTRGNVGPVRSPLRRRVRRAGFRGDRVCWVLDLQEEEFKRWAICFAPPGRARPHR